MTSEKLYLKSNVVVEPLVDQWYAWAHLISPATAAMNIVGRHLPIMESYVKAPQMHQAAAKNPKMAGGPFIDYDRERVAEIRGLIEWTRQERAPMLELARAIVELDRLLQSEAQGFSLEPLYARIPAPLRGYVELGYDLSSNPSFRFVEPLLYESRYYDPRSQSLMLSLIHGDDRPFILSTPRLDGEQDVHLRIPFRHEGIDELFKMKRTPQTFEYLKERLELDDEHDESFRRFLTSEPPAAYVPYDGKGVRWRYFGHACILVETRGVSILLDPILSYTYESDVSRYTYDNLPDRIDYVLITHNHQDHILFETMLQLRHKIGTVITPRNGGGHLQDPSLKLLLRKIGFRDVIEIDELGSIDFDFGSITGIPFFGEHGDLEILTKMAYLVKLKEHSLLFAADSSNIEPTLYEKVHDVIGDIDIVFVGMECQGAPMSWVYGPLLTRPLDRSKDQTRRLSGSNFERASDIVRRFNCREVYVYAMGQEPWLNYISSIKYTEESLPIVASNQLIEESRSRGLVAERLFGEKEILLS